MKTFTYVIAPYGCKENFTPGKRYDVISLTSNIFEIRNDFGIRSYYHTINCYSLNGLDWIIPEIGQGEFVESKKKFSRIEIFKIINDFYDAENIVVGLYDIGEDETDNGREFISCKYEILSIRPKYEDEEVVLGDFSEEELEQIENIIHRILNTN